MLAFEFRHNDRTIEITCDDAGIDSLIGVLSSLKGSGSHVHLRAPAHDKDVSAKLSPVTPFGDPAITEVVISHGGE